MFLKICKKGVPLVSVSIFFSNFQHGQHFAAAFFDLGIGIARPSDHLLFPPTGTQNPQRWNFQLDIQDATNNFILWYCVVSYDIVLVLHGIFIVLHGIARGCFVMYGIALYRIK